MKSLSTIAAQAVLEEPASSATVPSEELNAFALRLAHKAIEPDSEANALISPLSVSTCLSMLANGADGATRELVAKTLGTKASDLEAWNKGNLALMQTLLRDKQVDFAVANSLWTFADTPPKEEFVSLLKRSYGAEALNLQDRSAASVEKINDWTEENTRGRIPSIIERIDPRAFAILVNALAFDGQWETKFDASDTKPRGFQLASGRTVSVPMMSGKDFPAFGWEFNDRLTACSLPYRGKDYRLLMLLPPPGTTVSNLLAELTSDRLKEIQGKLHADAISVVLPRFSATTTTDLEPVLTAMGAGKLFETRNDFSRISPAGAGAFVSQAVHKAVIEWDEEGTRANATTDVLLAAGIGPIHRFVADRPFVYLLVHQPTNTILFIGLCNDPS